MFHCLFHWPEFCFHPLYILTPNSLAVLLAKAVFLFQLLFRFASRPYALEQFYSTICLNWTKRWMCLQNCKNQVFFAKMVILFQNAVFGEIHFCRMSLTHREKQPHTLTIRPVSGHFVLCNFNLCNFNRCQFNRSQFQPLAISTVHTFNLLQFQPTAISTYHISA